LIIVIKKRNQTTQLVTSSNDKPADNPMQDIQQAVEDEFLKKELLKFAADLED
jgi:spore germination protein YaaH